MRRTPHAGAVRVADRLRGVADRDRRGYKRGVLHRVVGNAEGGGTGEGLDPQLDQVGCVLGVARVGGVGVGAVWPREDVARRAGVLRIAGAAGGTVVVVEEVLVEELAAPVGSGAGDEDRGGVPKAAVRELG